MPTNIIHAYQEVYVCMSSDGGSTEMDYWVQRLDENTGQTVWHKRYDFAGLDDVPVNMIVDNNQNPIVTGFSGNTPQNGDMATVKYSSTNGLLLDERRLYSNLQHNQPIGLLEDASGDFYIASTISTDSIDFDIRTTKLDADLNLLWYKDYSSGLLDTACVTQLDAAGNVVVVGSSTYTNGQTEIFTLNYKPNGQVNWQSKRLHPSTYGLLQARHIQARPDTSLALVAHENGQLFLLMYDRYGSTLVDKYIGIEDQGYTIPMSSTPIDSSSIYISSLHISPTVARHKTSRVSLLEYDDKIVYDNMGEPSHAKNQVIVKFREGVISTQFIDNKELRFSRFGDALNSNRCLQDIEAKLKTTDFSSWKISKVFPSTSTTDTLKVTRTGRTIRKPDFWNTFLLHVPDGYREIVGEVAIVDTLDSDDLWSCIGYAEINSINLVDAGCDPNDPIYNQQAHLHPILDYPDGSINVEPAWCIAGGGSQNITIAIVDSGARWSHEDFGDGTPTGSVVVGGTDYTENGNPSVLVNSSNDVSGHGSRVASIVAAKRNNGVGVAGIAGGGDASGGARVIAQKAYFTNDQGQTGGYYTDVYEAFQEAVDVYDVDMLNLSGSGHGEGGSHPTAHKVVQYLNRAGVIISASRGNGHQNSQPQLPGTIYDDWVMCVAGTGIYSTHYWTSRTGDVIDFGAPAQSELIRAATSVDANGTQSNSAYGPITQTSAAAPHAIGVAALLQSYHEQFGLVIAQEDAEYIMQVTAFDGAPMGYDEFTGHGRIDAGAALQLVERPSCELHHFAGGATSSILLEDDILLELLYEHENTNGDIFPAGVYIVDVYEVHASITHSIPSGHQISHHWVRHSATTTSLPYDPNANPVLEGRLKAFANATFVGLPGNTFASLKGYVYYAKSLDGTIEGWLTTDPINAEFSYSLITCNNSSTNNLDAKTDLTLYPNPATNTLLIRGSILKIAPFLQVDIFDITGRRMNNMTHSYSGNAVELDVSTLRPGTYVISLLLPSGKKETLKFVKR